MPPNPLMDLFLRVSQFIISICIGLSECNRHPLSTYIDYYILLCYVGPYRIVRGAFKSSIRFLCGRY